MLNIERWDTSEIIHSGDFISIRKCLEDGVKKGICFYGANLEGVNLRRADLEGVNLRRADLRRADLKGVNLRRADLEGANLEGANLRRADLEGANLEGANLRRANLEGVNLRRADLRRADLRRADLYVAKNYYSFFAYDTSKRIVHCVKHKRNWMIQAGCFWGTLEELEKEVRETHNSPVYLANIEILKALHVKE